MYINAVAFAGDGGTVAAAQQNAFAGLLPILIIFIIFYFLLIRPQQKKQVEHKKMIEALQKNQEVVTAGGIHGVITNVKDDTVILKVDDNTKIEVEKMSILIVTKKTGEQNAQ